MTEARVVDAFEAWLVADGWTVQREVDYCDLVARRAGRELRVEAKGDTSEPGLDADTLYGQILRRMVIDEHISYAIVGPPKSVAKMVRVRAEVRARLRILVFEVAPDGSILPR